VRHNTLILGSINTAVLLCSSFSVALGVHMLRDGQRWASVGLVALTVFLALCFVAIKLTEYGIHFREGIYPGGVGKFFDEHHEPGIKLFFTLYYAMTGLHALHVIVGGSVLAVLGWKIARRRILQPSAYVLEIGAIYWHLVDVIWIFLWPLFYLVPGTAP
jgi:cytochrome c oxidase subunit 3